MDDFLRDITSYFISKGDVMSAVGANISAATAGNEAEDPYAITPTAGGPVVVVAGSDFQNSGGDTAGGKTVTSILDQMGYSSVDGILFGGDYSYSMSTSNNLTNLDGYLDDYCATAANRIYIQGNHDTNLSPSSSSNLLATEGGHDPEGGAYGVYAINHEDFPWSGSSSTLVQGTANLLKAYLDGKAAANYTKPIFVMSHLPLHYTNRGDNDYANLLFDVLNSYDKLNIIFLFGHNHSTAYDSYLGQGSIYLKKGDAIKVAKDGATSYNDETLNFTYMNYGYTGYIGSTNADATLTMTAFEISDSEVAVKRYSTSGQHTLKAAGGNTQLPSGVSVNSDVYGQAAINLTTGESTISEISADSGDDNTGSGGTTGGSSWTYELVTSIEAGEQYVIVGNDDPVALMDNGGSFGSQTVTISGTTLTSDVALTEWTISGTSGGTIVSDQGNGLSYSNSSFNLTGAADNTFNINAVNNNFTILTVRANSYYSKYYFNYDGSGWTSKPTSTAYVRLYKLTGTGTGGGSTVTPEGGDWVTISSGVGGTIYTLTDTLEAGKEYLIVSANSGSGYALQNPGVSSGSVDMGATAVDIQSGSTAYITTDATDIVWTATNNGSVIKLTNGNNYLEGKSGGVKIYSASQYENRGWEYESNQLKYTGGSNTYIVYYDGGFTHTYSSTSNKVYLFAKTGTEAAGDAEYAKLDGELTYTVARGASEEAALAAVKEGINVLTSASADGSNPTTKDDSDTNIKWTLADNYDGSTPGEYAVTISYKGVTLGTAKVIVPEATINGITVSPSYGTVTVGASEAALVGATITVDVDDDEGEDYTVPVTVGMLEGDFDTQTVGVYENLTVSYNGFTYTGFTLTVKEKVVDNYPSYPNEGAVKVDKTAHGVDFQKTGVARVELSTSGVPMNQGVDVLLVLDTSSSMGMQGSLTDNGRTRMDVLKECVNALILNLKKDRLDGSAPNIDIAIVDFNGYTGNKNTNYIGSTARTTSTIGGQLTDGWVDIRTLSDTWANNNIPDDRSGTNYDHGLLQAYDLLKQKQSDNGDNTRKQFVLFMSDGAPFQYNGVNSNSLSSDWENWILGSYTLTQVEALSHVANPEFYYGNNNGNGQKHRVAEAIKGAPASTFQIVTYSDTSSSGTTKLEEVNGLGATMYSVGLALEATNMPTDAAGQEAILKTIASSDDVFYSVTSAAGLQEAFDDFAGAILYAAENAVFEDQLGEHYNIQLASTTTRLVDGEVFTLDPAPTMEVREYTIWTRAELEDENGNLSDENAKKVGTRKTNADGSYIYTTLEKVSFNAEGTEAYSGDSTNNIMVNDVIYANTFWYNNGTETVQVDKDGDGTAEFDLAPETFIWKVGTIKTKEIALSYYVYLDDSLEGDASAGSYATNEYAILSYDNYLGNPCEKETVSPQLAWLSANVSYAYYLVNKDGQPVNINGEVVTFANREIIVHPTFFDDVKLNSIEDVENLTVASTGVLDEGNYALYDYDAKYQLNVNSDATGGWEITVGNGKALSTYVTGFSDTLAFTNATESTSDEDNYDYTHTTVWFAVVWEPKALDDTVVIDYGLPVDVHVLENDFFGEFGELIGVAAGTVTDSDGDVTTNEVSKQSADGTYGTAEVIKPEKPNPSNSVIRYTLNDKTTEKNNGMQMGATDVFTYSVEYTNTKLHTNNGFYYGTLTIIPATSIYYEETFLTFINASGVADTIKVESDGEAAPGDWFTVGSRDDATQDEDRPGDINFAFDTVVDANNVYGYDSAYNNYTTYSLGAAEKVTVNLNIADKLEKAPHAQFTFKGAGFDIVSLTDNDSGVIKVTATGKDTGTTKSMLVNNYYGYSYGYLYDTNGVPMFRMADGTLTKKAYDASGNEYTTQELLAKVDENTGEVTIAVYDEDGDKMSHAQGFYVDEDAEGAIYQVPVIKMDLGVYDEYSVEVRVVYLYTQDMQKDETDSYSFWMDAVRIYNPAGVTSDRIDDTIEDAYKDDKESYPDYKEIGDLLIEQNALSTDPDTPGVVFIDGRNVVNIAVSDYSNPGPNNEVYLAEGQGIAFSLTASKKPLSTQIGAKLANGSNGILMYNGEQLLENGLSTATDMYYEIDVKWTGDDENGYTSDVIVLSNGNDSELGTNVISLTNIKNTFEASGSTVGVGAAAQAAEVGMFMMRRLYTPVSEVFTPELFEADYSSNRNGKNVTVTVTASTDVEVITINGIEMSRYKEKKGVRTWTYKPKNNELADLYEIVAFNADGLASEPIYAGSENTDDLLGAETYINRMSQKVVKKLQKDMEKLANRIFTPEKFNKKLEKLADGAELMVVNTSEDVEYIIADGEILRNYITETIIDLSKDGEETVNRVWLVPNADENAEIAAYNAEGVASEVQNND